MSFTFKKAERSATKLRAALDGVSGSGKTFTSLRLAFGLVQAGLARRVAVIDTEHGSAAKYAGESPDGLAWDFDALELTSFGPLDYVAALDAAFAGGYDAVVVDSLSHAWSGTGGALDIVDRKAGGGGNKFAAWRDVTPMHNRLIDAIVQAPAHVIGTMRSKAEYVLEDNGRGKMAPVKKGMAPVQRDGMEYEFDLYGSLDLTHHLHLTKSRCRALDGANDINPGPRFWRPLFDWLKGGPTAPAPEPPKPAPAAKDPRREALSAALKAAGWTWARAMAFLAEVEPGRYHATTPFADVGEGQIDYLTRHLNTVAVQGA